MKSLPILLTLLVISGIAVSCNAQTGNTATVIASVDEFLDFNSFRECTGTGRATRYEQEGNGFAGGPNVVTSGEITHVNLYDGLGPSFDLELIFAAIDEAEFQIELLMVEAGVDFIPGSIQALEWFGPYKLPALSSNQETVAVPVRVISYERPGTPADDN